eukprot:2902045-Rhodomonas_salina.1
MPTDSTIHYVSTGQCTARGTSIRYVTGQRIHVVSAYAMLVPDSVHSTNIGGYQRGSGRSWFQLVPSVPACPTLSTSRPPPLFTTRPHFSIGIPPPQY